MTAVNDILSQLPIASLAEQLGVSPEEVQSSAASAIPALLGGLDANATDPAGNEALLGALAKHTDTIGDGEIDLASIDTAEGEKITQHIFGGQTPQIAPVAGLNNDLVKQLLPILAPIVLAWVAKQVLSGGAAGASTAGTAAPANNGGGALGGILTEVLKSGLGGGASGGALGGVLGNVLGGALGGALGGQAAQPQAPAPAPQPASWKDKILGKMFGNK